nr:SPOR domain-containing protein [Alteromonas lipotrueiana]
MQNRVVGTVIVVALAVIFLPDFLEGKKETQEATFASIPDTPAKKPIVEPDTFPAERVAQAAKRPLEVVNEPALDDIPEDTETSSPEASSSANAKPDDLASQTIVAQAADDDNSGWVVQLGSFRHQKNVKQLLAKLERAGYRAFSRPVKTNSGSLTKVFVGPDLNKQKLNSALPHLKEVTGLSGRITQFKVN